MYYYIMQYACVDCKMNRIPVGMPKYCVLLHYCMYFLRTPHIVCSRKSKTESRITVLTDISQSYQSAPYNVEICVNGPFSSCEIPALL